MRYSAVPFDPAHCLPFREGWWAITDSEKPGWVLFAGGEKEVQRLTASMNQDEADRFVTVPSSAVVEKDGMVWWANKEKHDA